LITLRVFGTDFNYSGRYDPTGRYDHTEGYLPFITQVSNQAPQLEYFSISNCGGKSHYRKLVCGEWVLSDEARFPPVHAFDM